MDPGSEVSTEGSETSPDPPREGRPLTPPSSGLARSIRSLFDLPRSSAPEILSPPGRSSTPPDSHPEDVDEPAGAKRSALRDRFVTRIASWLHADAGTRGRYAPGILEDVQLLRREGGFPLILDGVASLLSGAHGSSAEDGKQEAPVGAVSLAAEIMDPLLAHYLALRIGTEPEPALRDPLVRIVHAFPELAAPALAEVLVETSDRSARRTMRTILIELGEEGRGAALRLLDDPRWFAIRNGVRILADRGGAEDIQALTVVLGHPDRRVRKEAVITLSRIGGEDAGLLLVGMLSDAEPDVREVAAIGVGGLRVTRALRPLLEMVATEPEEEVLAQVLLALGEIGDPGAVPAIEKKALGSIFNRPPRAIRLAAYRALASIGTPHARALVEAGTRDRDEEVSRGVREILGRRSRGVADSTG